jgi:hypothetical protein
LSGVEIAQSDTRIIYVTMYDQTLNPSLVRSNDSGRTWTVIDETASLGSRPIWLAAVDPVDPKIIYLRIIDASGGDQLAISRNAGATMTLPLRVNGPLTMFYRRSDGALIAAGRNDVFISTDTGNTFSRWVGAPHLRALAERGGALFAVGDNAVDKFAVAVSCDVGAMWTPLLQFKGMCGLASCPRYQTTCATSWSNLQSFFSIPPNPCSGVDGGDDASASVICGTPTDAGSVGEADAGVEAGTDAGAIADGGTGGRPGCHCGVRGTGGVASALFAILARQRRRRDAIRIMARS